MSEDTIPSVYLGDQIGKIESSLCASLRLILLVVLVLRILLFKPINLQSGQTWMFSNVTKQGWFDICVSADGSKMAAVAILGGIYTSIDGGTNWNRTSAPNTNWSGIACSADGVKLIAVTFTGGSFFLSTNSGHTWNPTPVPPGSFWPVTSSTDARTVVAVGFPANVLISKDFGVTWTKSPFASCRSLQSVASSADGKRLIVVCSGEYGICNKVNISADFGATWKDSSLIGCSMDTMSVDCSADGNRLVAAGYIMGIPGPIYASADSGESWTRTSAPLDFWSSVASSADGTRLAAAGGTIHISLDSGYTWASIGAPSAVSRKVSLSADGGKLAVASQRGGLLGTQDHGIYYWHSTPAIPLYLQRAGNNLYLSWQTPSHPVDLLESPDLVAENWTVVNAVPILNFSDLRHEVTIPKQPGTMFYRLVSH